MTPTELLNGNGTSGGSNHEAVMRSLDQHLGLNSSHQQQQSQGQEQQQHFAGEDVTGTSGGEGEFDEAGYEDAEDVDEEMTLEEAEGEEACSTSEGDQQQQMASGDPPLVPPPNPQSEVAELKDNIRWLNHQMRQLMNSFNVPFCRCPECIATGLGQQQHGNKANGGRKLNGSCLHDSQFSETDLNGTSASLVTDLKVNLGGGGDGGELHVRRGRRSKYCTPNERKLVARYAQMYGASAAARKFGIPPAVAAYYHRKECRSGAYAPGQTDGGRLSSGIDQQTNGNTFLGKMVVEQPKLKIPPIGDATEGTDHQLRQDSSVSDGGAGGGGLGEEPLLGELNENWATQNNAVGNNGGMLTQQQAFLRGRGRGRPKLIGDELDAELVEWMVVLKQANPGRHINASQALTLARNYILEKSPGLLAENGGQVKLRITWAMKLLNRVAEREKEIQLGLPPGSLQNMSRSNNASNNNGNSNNGGMNITGVALDELQQLFGQVSNYQQGVSNSQNSFLDQDGGEGGSGGADQFLAGLDANGGIDNDILQKILGNLQSQAGDGVGFSAPSTSAASSNGAAQEFLAQTTGAF